MSELSNWKKKSIKISFRSHTLFAVKLVSQPAALYVLPGALVSVTTKPVYFSTQNNQYYSNSSGPKAY
jgi:hypothetical protein